MSTQLRIVHLASGDLWAGAEVQLYYLARALHNRGPAQLHVILLNHGQLEERLRAAGVSVHVLDEQRLGFPQMLLALRARLKALRPTIVHSHRYKEHLLAALALRGTHAVLVRSIHSAAQPPSGLRASIVRFADDLAARFQQAAVCVSPELVDGVRRRFPSLPLEVIENGVDTGELWHNANEPIDIAAFGDTGGTRPLRVGFVGRLVAIKRPDLFVALAHDLVREAPGRFSFHLFGEGPLQRSCSDFVHRHRLDGEVRLHGFRANLPAWLARLDALVICSDHEGLPMVLLEAMALGVPVVAHAVGGMPHVLGCGEHGLLVREQRTAAYARALLRLADEPQETRARAERARARVHARYSVGVIAERYLGLYDRLLAAPDERAPGVARFARRWL